MPPRTVKKVHPRRALPEDDDAFIREREVLDVYPVGQTSWRKGVAEGRYPRPVKLSPRVNGYRVGGIRALLAAAAGGDR